MLNTNDITYKVTKKADERNCSPLNYYSKDQLNLIEQVSIYFNHSAKWLILIEKTTCFDYYVLEISQLNSFTVLPHLKYLKFEMELSAEVHFAQRLACNQSKLSEKALKKVGQWLATKSVNKDGNKLIISV